MATFTTNVSADFSVPGSFFYAGPSYVLQATSSLLQVRTPDGGYQNYTGYFAYTYSGGYQYLSWPGSTLQSLTSYSSEWNQQASVSGLNISGSAYKSYAENNDASGLKIYALRENDNITGSAYNDVLCGYAGNDSINGGAGTDTAYFSGTSAQTQLTKTSTDWSAVGPDGTDTLVSIEQVRFSDKTISIDYSRLWGLEYIASYSDLIYGFGVNTDAGITHYVQHGAAEHRSLIFDPTNYLNTYSDLKEIYGNDVESATLHYIQYGYAEGRRVDITPPTILSLSPQDKSDDVDIATNVVVTFSEAIQRGIGSITIQNMTVSAIETYDVASNTANLSFLGSTLTINPSSDLHFNTDYSVIIAAGSIKDSASNSFATLTTYNFTTESIYTLIARNESALFDVELSSSEFATIASQASSNHDAFLNQLYSDHYSSTPVSTVSSTITSNLGITGSASDIAKSYISSILNNTSVSLRGTAVNEILNLFVGLTQDPIFGVFAATWKDKITTALASVTDLTNTINGTSDNDNLTGNSSDNFIYGVAGNDTLNGGDGNDSLYGGKGNDSLYGGTGNDTASYNDASSSVTVNLSGLYDSKNQSSGYHTSGGGGNDILSSIENAEGSIYNDTITGDSYANSLYGDAGNDTLNGGDGNDYLVGGVGDDSLYGGKGNDIFSFGQDEGVDIIYDFSYSQDKLAIDSGVNGITTASQAFTQLSNNSFGYAVLDLGAGNNVTLIGVSISSLTYDIFTFT